MGRSEINIKEKALLGKNQKGRGNADGHIIRREAFVGISEALKTIDVKFDCGEVNDEVRFS